MIRSLGSEGRSLLLIIPLLSTGIAYNVFVSSAMKVQSNEMIAMQNEKSSFDGEKRYSRKVSRAMLGDLLSRETVWDRLQSKTRSSTLDKSYNDLLHRSVVTCGDTEFQRKLIGLQIDTGSDMGSVWVLILEEAGGDEYVVLADCIVSKRKFGGQISVAASPDVSIGSIIRFGGVTVEN